MAITITYYYNTGGYHSQIKLSNRDVEEMTKTPEELAKWCQSEGTWYHISRTGKHKRKV